ncbi:hypothetical protein [Streptomyces sp. NPDC054838]
MTDEPSWENIKQAHPLGAQRRGRVRARFPFGVFLEIEQDPAVKVFMDVASYAPDTNPGDVVPLPPVGSIVEGVVVDHVDRDQQIRIRVGQPPWEVNETTRHDE